MFEEIYYIWALGGFGPPSDSTFSCSWTHMYGKHFFLYTHSRGNSACTQITFFVHEAILHVHIWRWGVLDHLVRKTRLAYIHSDPNSARTQNTLYGEVRPKWNQNSQGYSLAPRGRPIQFAGLGVRQST